MSIFYILFIIIVLGQVGCGIWNLIKTILFNKKLKSNLINEIKANMENEVEVVIVIPCLREQDIICRTMDYFIDISNDYDNIKIVIVTTQKEEYEKEKSLSKLELLANDILKGQSIASITSKFTELVSIK